MLLSRRSFVLLCAQAAAIAGCLPVTGTDAADVTLKSRPRTPSKKPKLGLNPLEADWVHDGFLFVPQSYSGQPKPLLVLLHGAELGATSWWSSGKLASLANELGVIVMTPESRGDTWDLLVQDGFGPDVRFIDHALDITFDRCAIDPTRIALGGFSDGATYALSLGLGNGDLFSALMGFSTGGIRPAAVEGKPRVYMTHGTDDPVLPFANGRAVANTLIAENYDVTFVEFDGGHAVSIARIRTALEWFLGIPSSA